MIFLNFFFCRLAKPKIMNRIKGLQKQTSSEDIAPSSREILQTFVWWTAQTRSRTTNHVQTWHLH